MAFDDAFTDSHRNKENIIALTFVRFFGLLSMIASGLLIRDIARKLYIRSGAFLQKVSLSQSILIVLAIGDFFAAFFVQVISTWMVPVHSQLLGAVGSQQSCVAQGFLSSFFYSLSALTNASLAVAYCLILRRGWDDKDKSRNRLPFVLIPAVEQHDEIEEVDGIGTTFSDSDNECDFIGNIEIMPISRLLSTHQRNIRKNAYDLLKRLGEEESSFDLNSATVEEDDCEEQRQQERESPGEVKVLNGRIGECTDMVIQLHNHIRSSNQVIDDDNVHTDGFNRGAGQASDEIIADLNAEISTLTSKLEEITKELMAVKKEKEEAMAMRLNIADDSSSRSSHSNKSARTTPFSKSSTKQTLY